MIKGIIVEVKKDYSIIITSSGGYEKVKNKGNMKVGSRVFIFEEDIIKEEKQNRTHKGLYKIIAIAAMVMFILTSVFLSKSNNTVYAMVTIDVNPSVQIDLDKDKNIKDISGLNNDGKALNFDEVIGENINEGMLKIKKIIEDGAKVKNEDVLVGFAFLDKGATNTQYEDDIKNVVDKTFKENKVAFIIGDEEEVKLANEKGVSLGKYKAFKDSDEAEDMLETMTVEELIKELEKKGRAVIFDKEDIQDELEDRYEDKNESKDDDDDKDEDQKEDDDKDDDDKDKDNDRDMKKDKDDDKEEIKENKEEIEDKDDKGDIEESKDEEDDDDKEAIESNSNEIEDNDDSDSEESDTQDDSEDSEENDD